MTNIGIIEDLTLVPVPTWWQNPWVWVAIATALVVTGYFVRRWSMETTFALVRAHLGVETQRQWSDPAILRTTPALLGLFSLVAIVGDRNRDG